MDDISTIINFELNENRPILDSNKVHDNDILNRSAENKLSAAESVAFLHSSPLTEKQVLTNVNNNFQNEKPNISFTSSECEVISNNSGENIAFLSAEAITTKTENSFSLACEAPSSIETSSNFSCKSLQSNCENDSGSKSAILSSSEIPVGNVNFPPDALSDNVLCDNEKNLSINAAQCNKMSIIKMENVDSLDTHTKEMKDEKNNSYGVVPDLVDFSFKEQNHVTEDLVGIGSLSENPETFLNSTLEEISVKNPDANRQESKPLSTSAKLLETDFANKVPNSPINIFKESRVPDNNESYNVLGHSFNSSSPLNLSEIPVKEALTDIITSDNISAEFEKPNTAAEEFSAVDSSSANNDLSEIPVKEALNAIITSDISAEFEKPNTAAEEFSAVDSSSANNDLSEIPVKEALNDITSDISAEFEKPNTAAEEFSAVDSSSANNEYREVNSDEAVFMPPENISNNEPDKVSPLKIEKVSFGMSDKSLEEFADPEFQSKVSSNNPLEEFSDPDFSFKVPEIPSNNPVGQFSEPDSTFKVPEAPSNNTFEQFSDPDFAFKVPEVPSNNPLEQFSIPDFALKMPENPLSNEGEEQFVDAVQFFKDPNSFQFLENIRTSTVQPESVPRSSLYINFDPLHSKFQNNVPRQDNCALITAAVQDNSASPENSEKCSPEVMNKHLVDVAARESLGNILISFDSPKSSTNVDPKLPVQTPTPPKLFTEEEVQQKLKIHELETQDMYIKKQREMEMEIAKRDELLKFQRMVMEEFCGVSANLSDDAKKGQEKIMSLEAENEKLKEDLKTSAEDLQSVENTFTDFYKRYEQCKGMLKTYKDNEEHLKQTISDLQTKAKEQEQMYHLLQERTEEMLEKANIEVDNVKRSGEAQVTVLKAQLKKAEMKISSLESDIKHIKEENNQLGGICDDLMAKVSRS